MNAWMRKTAALLLAITAPVQAQAAVYYIHTDALGSVVAETDANRNVVERREYEPYGAQLTPALADGPGYTGHVQDAATGLVYMQQRYYDPGLGRFLSVDPVRPSQDGPLFNRYYYASNNPLRFIDPDGRYTCSASAADCAITKEALSAIKEAGKKDAALAAVAEFYGDEGIDNGVIIDNLESETRWGKAKTEDGVTRIGINFRALEGSGSSRHASSTLAHEGAHGIDQRDPFGLSQ